MPTMTDYDTPSQNPAQARAEDDTGAVIDALKRKWGHDFQRRMEAASRFMDYLSLPPHSQRRLMAEMGHETMLERFAELGADLVGDERFSKGLPDGLVMSEAEAQDELEALEASEENQKILLDKIHPRHDEMIAHRRRLYAIAYPGTA